MVFDQQKGIMGVDAYNKKVNLVKDLPETLGKGWYPEDLEVEEFHSILLDMLKNGEKDEVAQILNQRSVVERDGAKLKAIPYTEKFKKEFTYMADELEKAAEVSTDKDFNEFLKLQAKALRTEDSMLDAYADKKWATLQMTPLEFTIARESYTDKLTETVNQNPELKKLLDENHITAYGKDGLGVRVGIVNINGTNDIIKMKEFLPTVAKNMPFSDKYEQNILSKDSLHTMVDVDIVDFSGIFREYRGWIMAASNLPNFDKLSVQKLNGGYRNVYHRQVFAEDKSEKGIMREKDWISQRLAPEVQDYYDSDVIKLYVMGHENGHTLGPINGGKNLGKYRSIIEENKANMVSMAMLDLLIENGFYTEEQKNKIIVTFLSRYIQAAMPNINQAHDVASLMQYNFFIEQGVIDVSEDGALNIHLEKFVPAAQKMLEKIIDVQLSDDYEKAEQYLQKYHVWNEDMQHLADVISKTKRLTNGRVESPLADKLLAE